MKRLTRRSFFTLSVAACASVSAGATARSGFFRRHGLPIGMQLYAAGPAADEDLEGTFRKVAAIGYRTVELNSPLKHRPPEIRAAADRNGLTIQSIHRTDVELGVTQDDAKRVADTAAVLGAKDIVMPFVPLPLDASPQKDDTREIWVDRTIRRQGAGLWHRLATYLNDRGAALQREGLRFSYHNHNIEFAAVDGTSGWEILQRETDPALVSFEVDVGWVAAAGLDPVQFVLRHKGRLRQMHVKDLLASTKPNYSIEMDSVEVGSGMIDWKRLLNAGYAAGIRQFYVEQEPPFTMDRFESLAKSFQFLSSRV